MKVAPQKCGVLIKKMEQKKNIMKTPPSSPAPATQAVDTSLHRRTRGRADPAAANRFFINLSAKKRSAGCSPMVITFRNV